MASQISPENEQFIQREISSGTYRSREELLNKAVDLLKGRRQLLDHVDEGSRQLRNGEGLKLEGENEQTEFFDDIQTRGRERYERSRKS